MKRNAALLLLILVMALTLSGCLFSAPEDLYQSPERSADYLSLTQTIQNLKATLAQQYGAEASDTSVMAGNNTAQIQLQDLDGDGLRETAVTFFRISEAEKPLKICFFTKTAEDTYTVSAMVEGNGSSIYRVDYVDLDGSGYREVVVSWQMSTGSYLLGAYSIEEPMSRNVHKVALPASSQTTVPTPIPQLTQLKATEWMTTAYSGYTITDIDQDTRSEVAVARLGTGGVNNAVDVYGWRDGSFLIESTAPLSDGIVSLEVNGVKENFVAGEVPARALYVSSQLSDGRRAVDILTYQGEHLANLTLEEEGVSREQLDRYVDLDPTDVNSDGILELPSPVPLPGSEESATSDFLLIDWYQYSQSGRRTMVCTTYHNVSDGWYLVIPQEWKSQIVLRRNDSASGQRAVIFYHTDGNQETPFLVIYKFTSQFERATISNRFELRREDDAVYAAAFYDSGWNPGISETDLLASFHLIQSSWAD